MPFRKQSRSQVGHAPDFDLCRRAANTTTTKKSGRTQSVFAPQMTNSQAIGSKQYRWLTVLFGALAIYCSLVPFSFKPRPWAEVIGQSIESWNSFHLPTRSGRSDFAANVLLFIPLTFCATGSLAADGASKRSCLAFLFVLPAACLFSMALEFAQFYFPGRVPSVGDSIAQMAGAALGTVLWMGVGHRITQWARATWLERSDRGLAARLFPAYLVVLLLIHIMPLNLITSPADLYHKYRAGRINLVPFHGAAGSPGETITNLAVTLALFLPAGYLYRAQRAHAAGAPSPPWALVSTQVSREAAAVCSLGRQPQEFGPMPPPKPQMGDRAEPNRTSGTSNNVVNRPARCC